MGEPPVIWAKDASRPPVPESATAGQQKRVAPEEGPAAIDQKNGVGSEEDYLSEIADLKAKLEAARREVHRLRTAQADAAARPRPSELHVFLLRCLRDYEAAKCTPPGLRGGGSGQPRLPPERFRGASRREVLESITDSQTLIALLSEQFFPWRPAFLPRASRFEGNLNPKIPYGAGDGGQALGESIDNTDLLSLLPG